MKRIKREGSQVKGLAAGGQLNDHLRRTAAALCQRPGWLFSRAFCWLALAAGGFGGLAAMASPAASAACSNSEFRTGPSAHLPDCRAYELVTPPEINGGIPEAGTSVSNTAVQFTTPSAFDGGNTYVWTLNNSGLPGTGSDGIANPYAARRTDSGWVSAHLGPSVLESSKTSPGTPSSDLNYLPFVARSRGSLVLCPGCEPIYIQYPDGSYHLAGEGTVPTATDTDGNPNGFVDNLEPVVEWISPGGAHQIIGSRVPLLDEAPPAATNGVYDRTPQGLKLVSRMPDTTPNSIPAVFAGSSADGSTVLFKVDGGSLFARVDNAKTIELAKGELGQGLAGGVSIDGSRAFYVQNGNIFAYDFDLEEAMPVTEAGNATLVTISPDGSHAYFLSETELVAGQGQAGQLNMYVWDGSTVRFIATVSPADLAWEDGAGGYPFGLAMWTALYRSTDLPAENDNRLSNTTRTTPDGDVIAFESAAQLTDFPNEGHFEVYRYDTTTEELDCVSCSRVEPAASADSWFDFRGPGFSYQRVSPMIEVHNLSEDGEQVVFESVDRLLPGDTNGARDVYRWRNGELSLISTGEAEQHSLLVGVSPQGSDIFFRTGQSLVGQGQEAGALAIYDARVGGGLASQLATPPPSGCAGEGCLGDPDPGPGPLSPASSVFHGSGNLKKACRRHLRRLGKRVRKSYKHKRACRRRKSGSRR
jgi:hypothetical protein